ncbi:unnamed protein product [Penicillium roqueforti FM164]|uniref:Genomic scaffold, ProqFM164S01 n=1 Tax=Penicillium roqueforti (strain FM164) TaxID=1365484 RepID=W6PYS1_PENRF|nr:unnamed protein product [Penicillium roqueforti FM164]
MTQSFQKPDHTRSCGERFTIRSSRAAQSNNLLELGVWRFVSLVDGTRHGWRSSRPDNTQI